MEYLASKYFIHRDLAARLELLYKIRYTVWRVYFVGENFCELLALACFANKNYTDYIFVLATPYRRYSIHFRTQQQICEIRENVLPRNKPTIRYTYYGLGFDPTICLLPIEMC